MRIQHAEKQILLREIGAHQDTRASLMHAKAALADAIAERDAANEQHGENWRVKAGHLEQTCDALRLALKSVGAAEDEFTAPYRITDIVALHAEIDDLKAELALYKPKMGIEAGGTV